MEVTQTSSIAALTIFGSI